MPALIQLQQELLPIIEDRLKSFLSEMDFDLSPQLEEMLTYHMGWHPSISKNAAGGKRIRPLLTLLCHGAFQPAVEKALPGAVAVELLHNFTLIHDDIEDNSPLRHGQPTLWNKWGLAQAINAGDALFSISQMAILSLRKSCGVEAALKAAEKMNAAFLHLTRGQYLDIAFETMTDVNNETYFEMVGGKTAALIAFATELGGLTAGQNSSIQENLSKYGKSVGLSFQIQDDILGIWGNPNVTGKSISSDLLAQKKSLPVLYGLAHSMEFGSIWSKQNPSQADIQLMSGLLESCGARDYAINEARRHTNEAFRTLGGLFPQRNRYSEALFELTGQLLNRSA